MLVFNGAIVLLIVFDNDRRNKQYRKYMCCLQVNYFFIILSTFIFSSDQFL